MFSVLSHVNAANGCSRLGQSTKFGRCLFFRYKAWNAIKNSVMEIKFNISNNELCLIINKYM